MSSTKESWASPAPARNSLILFGLISAFLVAARFRHIITYPLWFDEIFTVRIARLDWGDLVHDLSSDIVQAPLFYFLLKVWVALFGESLFVWRLLPVLIASVAVIPFYFLCRESKLSDSARNTALALLAANGFLIYYADEVRMYSLALCCSICSFWIFLRVLNGTGRLKYSMLLLTAANILLVYTQYFGWLVIGAEAAVLLIWRRDLLLVFMASSAAVVLSFVPWGYLVIRSSIANQGLENKIGWISRPVPYDLLEYFALLNGKFDMSHTALFGLVLFACPILFWVRKAAEEKDRQSLMLIGTLALLTLFPVVFTFIVSQFLPQSVWEPRYLTIALVPYLLLVAGAAHRLYPGWLKTALLTLIISWATISGAASISRSDAKFHWDRILNTIASSEAGHEKLRLYSLDDWVSDTVRFHMTAAEEEKIELNTVRIPAEIQGKHSWVVYRDITWRQASLPQVLLKQRGCLAGPEYHFSTPAQSIILFPLDCPP